MSVRQLFETTEQKLKTISPSMCLAKWTQVTLHLGTGTTHSCHHPAPHSIPLVELQRSPNALHNTQFKKEQRQLMLQGIRPNECDYCWRIEDAHTDGEQTFSDRITKSSEPWAMEKFDEIAQAPWDIDIYPTYVEIDFDTTCNFKCVYCSPSYSTTWMAEINKHGPFKLTGGYTHHDLQWLKDNGTLPISQSDDNPYVDAFWKWWPDAAQHIKVFRITGGEPLLSKNTFRLLDDLIVNPRPEMEFNINSNLGIPSALFDQFVAKMEIIQANKCVKLFKLYTSCEAAGPQANYIRYGMDYQEWRQNCRRVLSRIPRSNLTIMAAVNFLSIPSFGWFVKDVIELKEEFASQNIWPHRVALDTPYVRWPEFLAAWILNKDHLALIEITIRQMKAYRQSEPHGKVGFSDFEINRFERLFFVIREEFEKINGTEKQALLRVQFKEYITELDHRRGTDFCNTFTEYTGFFNSIAL